MHIVLVTPEFPPHKHGGVGTLMRECAVGLKESGHDVTVIHALRCEDKTYTEEDIQLDIPVTRIFLSPPKWLRWKLGELWVRFYLWRFVAKVHAKSPVTGIFVNEGGAYFPWGAPGGIPVVSSLTGTEYLFHKEMQLPRENEFNFNLQRRAMLKSRLLVANSNYTARAIPECYGLTDYNMQTIYHAVDTELFCPASSGGFEQGLVVFANSIEPRKGVQQLLEAFKMLADEIPEMRLMLAGRDVKKGPSGKPLSRHLWDELPASLQSRVTFLGPLKWDALIPLLQKAHVCCYPSYIETFGYAPAEAMSAGKAVIYSNTGPGPELIEHGISGMLCDPRSPESIADCLRAILCSPERTACFGANARVKALELFEKKAWAKKMVGVFEEISRGKRN